MIPITCKQFDENCYIELYTNAYSSAGGISINIALGERSHNQQLQNTRLYQNCSPCLNCFWDPNEDQFPLDCSIYLMYRQYSPAVHCYHCYKHDFN